jgi:hypothetical protein
VIKRDMDEGIHVLRYFEANPLTKSYLITVLIHPVMSKVTASQAIERLEMLNRQVAVKTFQHESLLNLPTISNTVTKQPFH